jgi:hypothetical protein
MHSHCVESSPSLPTPPTGGGVPGLVAGIPSPPYLIRPTHHGTCLHQFRHIRYRPNIRHLVLDHQKAKVHTKVTVIIGMGTCRPGIWNRPLHSCTLSSFVSLLRGVGKGNGHSRDSRASFSPCGFGRVAFPVTRLQGIAPCQPSPTRRGGAPVIHATIPRR